MLWGVEMPPHEKGYTQINTLGGEQTFCRGVVKHYPIVPNVDSIHIGRKQLFVNPMFNIDRQGKGTRSVRTPSHAVTSYFVMIR